MMGTLFVLDAYDCRNMPKGTKQLLEWALEAVKEAGMRPIETVAQHFGRDEWQDNMGDSVVTLIVPLTESHLAIHTWPHYSFVSVDLYTCGAFEPALEAITNLEHLLDPRRREFNYYFRGRQIRKEER